MLRAVGICAVVATHMSLWYFPGGAHLMLAVVGYNISRFHLSIDGTGDASAPGCARSAASPSPSIACVGVCMLLVGGYGLPTLALVNNYLGPPSHLDGRWHYWFIEALVQLVLLVTLLLAIAPVRRLERRFPYVLPAAPARRRARAARAVGGHRRRRQPALPDPRRRLVLRPRLARPPLDDRRPKVAHDGAVPADHARLLRPARAGVVHRPRPRRCSSGAATSRSPASPSAPIAVVAAASMVIYISHFRIWPPLDRNLPRGVAYVLTIAAGIALWFAGGHAARLARRATARLRARRRAPAPTTTIAVALD